MNRSQVLQLLQQPLDGYSVEVVAHSDPSLKGRSGTIVSETRRMLEVEPDSQNLDVPSPAILVPKLSGKFRIIGPSGSFVVEGHLLEGDAKRRTKRRLRYW